MVKILQQLNEKKLWYFGHNFFIQTPFRVIQRAAEGEK